MRTLDPALEPRAVLAPLRESVRQLVIVNTTMYQGEWDDFEEDIRRRQAGKPYVFRVDLEPREALAWVQGFRAYERASGKRLADGIMTEEAR